MKKIQVLLLVAFIKCLSPAQVRAANFVSKCRINLTLPVSTPDSDIVNRIAKRKLKAALSKANRLNPVAQFNGLQANAAVQVKRATSSFDDAIKKIQNKPLSFNLSLENATRFQPPPGLLTVFPNQKLINEVSLSGNLMVYGIPLNMNYTNAKATFGTNSALRNDLFKFDFDPRQFSSMFKSDFQRYYDLRRTAFAGMDINSFAKQAVLKELKDETSGIISAAGSNSALARYFSNSKTDIGEFLTLDDDKLKQKLLAVAKEKQAAAQPLGKEISQLKGRLPVNLRVIASERAKLQAEAINSVTSSRVLADYMSKPALVEELHHMSEDKIRERLSIITADRKTPTKDYINNIKVVIPATGTDLSEYIKEKIRARSEAKSAAIDNLAYKIASSQINGKAVATSELLKLSPQENDRINSERLNTEVATVASGISKIKKELQDDGYDVGKLVQMQKYLDGSIKPSETTSQFFTKKPTSSIQSFFTKFQALKLGSYGTKVPAGTQDQDVFVQGTHVTFKSNNTPITLGYGNVNDVASLKDASFQSAVYNSPKSITYIGADVNTSAYGKVKIAVVSSFNNGIGNSNNYAMPTIQGNSTAVTLTRAMDMGKIGNVTVDVSKSNTLYNNNYVQGSEAIFDRKAGLNSSQGMDLFQSVSVGLNQHLDIKELNMTDNVYFNYAGMGYQNPGNNGYGGARMKLGANVKKSLYKNKLVLSVRTDLRNMPISYTSDDKWKNYQLQLDSRYQLSKKLNISLKYSANGTSKKVDNLVSTVYSFQKIQLDGNASYKIGKNNSVSHFSISKQDYSNSFVNEAAGNMLMLNYTQTLMLHKSSLTGTVFYNKELSAYKLIGNMLNSDLSYQFKLFNKLNLSTGATYLDNAGIARQAGLRQSVQLFGGKNFDMDTYVDIRKNLVIPLYPDLYSACRAELRLRYHL